MARGVVDSFEHIHPLTRSEWRMWLAENHDASPGIWFVFFKKHTGKPRVSYDEIVEEALCYGWIDSLQLKIDEDRAKLLVTPRKPKSVWSRLNKTRIEQLVADGLMTEFGLAKIEQAKLDGSWNTLDSSDNLEMPEDLIKALEINLAAKGNWDAFTASVRRNILYWLGTAKRDETRNARVEKIVAMAAEGKRANYDK